jgi:hypothetical protein
LDRERAIAELEKNKKRKKGKRKTFILKPSGGSQGEGILLVQDAAALGAARGRRSYVLQRYVGDCHLLPGLARKWDIRVYVTVASLDPPRVLLHREGLVRFATAEYEPPHAGNLHNTMSHLTNYSLNKRSENYVNGEAGGEGGGSKRALSSCLQIPGFLPAGMTASDLYAQLASLAHYTMAALLPLLRTNRHTSSRGGNPLLLSGSFQTFGLDVLVDERGGTWLLEANSNPSMRLDHEGERSEVDERVKGSVMEEVLREVGGGEEGGSGGKGGWGRG